MVSGISEEEHTYIKVKCPLFDTQMKRHNATNDQLQEKDDFVNEEAVISKASRELGFIRFE